MKKAKKAIKHLRMIARVKYEVFNRKRKQKRIYKKYKSSLKKV